MLVDDVDFRVWVHNLLYGNFSAFSMAMVGSDMALLNSITSPLPSTPRFAEMHPLQILTIPKRIRLADRGTANNGAAQPRNVLNLLESSVIPPGWGGHNRTVSMPNFPAQSGFEPPTRPYVAPSNEEIAELIRNQYRSPTPPALEERLRALEILGARTNKSDTSRTTMYSDYVKSGGRPAENPYTATSPSPSAPSFRMDTSSEFHGTEPAIPTGAPTSAAEASNTIFEGMVDNAISATQAACAAAMDHNDLYAIEARLDMLNDV